MKKLVVLAAVATGGLMFSAGCETPAYSTNERFQLIGRTWGYEYEQINDDVDHIFLLRPVGRLTDWDIQ